jgi:hypothetical protein
MPNGMRWVGLDVHAHASTVAVFDDVTGGWSRAGSTAARWRCSMCCVSCHGHCGRSMRRARPATASSAAPAPRALGWAVEADWWLVGRRWRPPGMAQWLRRMSRARPTRQPDAQAPVQDAAAGELDRLGPSSIDRLGACPQDGACAGPQLAT